MIIELTTTELQAVIDAAKGNINTLNSAISSIIEQAKKLTENEPAPAEE